MFKNNNHIYIPLGNDCSVAHFLRKENLRNFALPFDWNVTPLKSVVMLIENKFEDFLDPVNLIYEEPCQRLLFKEKKDLEIKEDIITPVICRKYEMLFPHDFSVKGLDDLALVKDKYLKRIIRFQKLMNDRNTIIVFVVADSKLNIWQNDIFKKNDILWANDFSKQKKLLKRVIRKEFPSLKFSIVNFNSFALRRKLKNIFA